MGGHGIQVEVEVGGVLWLLKDDEIRWFGSIPLHSELGGLGIILLLLEGELSCFLKFGFVLLMNLPLLYLYLSICIQQIFGDLFTDGVRVGKLAFFHQ